MARAGQGQGRAAAPSPRAGGARRVHARAGVRGAVARGDRGHRLGRRDAGQGRAQQLNARLPDGARERAKGVSAAVAAGQRGARPITDALCLPFLPCFPAHRPVARQGGGGGASRHRGQGARSEPCPRRQRERPRVRAHGGPASRRHLSPLLPTAAGARGMEPGRHAPSFTSRVQCVFCGKVRNGGKLSSHHWFFNGFVDAYRPEFTVLLDVGTRPGPRSVMKLVTAMVRLGRPLLRQVSPGGSIGRRVAHGASRPQQIMPNIGGACGDIAVRGLGARARQRSATDTPRTLGAGPKPQHLRDVLRAGRGGAGV